MDPASPGGSHSHSNSDQSSEKRRNKSQHNPSETPVAITGKCPAIVTDHELPNGHVVDKVSFPDGTDLNMHCILTKRDNEAGVNEDTSDSDKVRILVQLKTLKS